MNLHRLPRSAAQPRRFIQMIPVHAAPVKNINSAAAENRFKSKKIRKQVKLVVELDQFKYTLSTFKKPLVEVRDSL